jgi:Raf kinase inhibitor-like YbhB/YbcL family protein
VDVDRVALGLGVHAGQGQAGPARRATGRLAGHDGKQMPIDPVTGNSVDPSPRHPGSSTMSSCLGSPPAPATMDARGGAGRTPLLPFKPMRIDVSVVVVAAFAMTGGVRRAEAEMKEPSGISGKPAATIKLSSSAFTAGGAIPSVHTCEGPDTSPPLAWEGVPAGTKALALVVDDPDAPDPAAPKRVWVHWVVALPAGTATLAAGALPSGATVGKNDWGNAAWGGPCPPVGRHRYFFKLYAVDTAVDAGGRDKAALLKAIDGHVLGRGELIGTYQKQR